jgi:dienelactone hydrolase
MLNSLKQEAMRLDATFLDGVASREQWEARRPELKQQYLEMLGLWPMPERTPLQPEITGALERDEGFRVENLHFQSRPHLYVTGNLYLPKDAKPGAKLPAVLYVCGHSGRDRDGNKTAFQQHGMWFATHGFVCLIIDTLQLGEIAAIHHGTYRYNRWWWQARGYTPAGVECWNGIRALDYLQSRPEVDGERIGLTGISGGGAATFWIAAADERVKVAVPVSGMGDLEDYVGEKVVNGHCDCMFLINTFQWPWTQIAALVAPRPMLFANSGHDTIFPMNGNDRIRARLERLYRFYTDRPDKLFDIAVAPGGHEDKVELRLMAYRWINRHLRGEDKPVTEPDLPKIEGKLLRAFPNDLPADQINTTIDEVFVPLANPSLPQTKPEFEAWRNAKLDELRRVVFRDLPQGTSPAPSARSRSSFTLQKESSDVMTGRFGMSTAWKSFLSKNAKTEAPTWLVVVGDDETLDARPTWAAKFVGEEAMVVLAPRGVGPTGIDDPPPFFIQRSLPLLGRTVDGIRLEAVVSSARRLYSDSNSTGSPGHGKKIIGHGRAGVMAAYAAAFELSLTEIVLVDPPASHREGPIFLNVLRVIDVPAALGLLAPRPLTIVTANAAAFEQTQALYRVAGGTLKIEPLP